MAESEPTGFLDWIKILGTIEDEELKQICGPDAALFVIFNRYAAIFFFISALFGLIVLAPMYATGDPEDPALI